MRCKAESPAFTNGSPAFLEMGFSFSQPFFRGGIYAVDGRLPYYSHQRQLLSLSALVDGRDARSEFVGLGGSLHLKRQEKYRENLFVVETGGDFSFLLRLKQ